MPVNIDALRNELSKAYKELGLDKKLSAIEAESEAFDKKMRIKYHNESRASQMNVLHSLRHALFDPNAISDSVDDLIKKIPGELHYDYESLSVEDRNTFDNIAERRTKAYEALVKKTASVLNHHQIDTQESESYRVMNGNLIICEIPCSQSVRNALDAIIHKAPIFTKDDEILRIDQLPPLEPEIPIDAAQLLKPSVTPVMANAAKRGETLSPFG